MTLEEKIDDLLSQIETLRNSLDNLSRLQEDCHNEVLSKLDEILENKDDDYEKVTDDQYVVARKAVIEAGKASTAYLQRKLRIGYARAARLMDMLEEGGVIGPGDGAKPRKVLLEND